MGDFLEWIEESGRAKLRWRLEKRLEGYPRYETILGDDEELFIARELHKIIPVIRYLKTGGRFNHSELLSRIRSATKAGEFDSK